MHELHLRHLEAARAGATPLTTAEVALRAEGWPACTFTSEPAARPARRPHLVLVRTRKAPAETSGA